MGQNANSKDTCRSRKKFIKRQPRHSAMNNDSTSARTKMRHGAAPQKRVTDYYQSRNVSVSFSGVCKDFNPSLGKVPQYLAPELRLAPSVSASRTFWRLPPACQYRAAACAARPGARSHSRSQSTPILLSSQSTPSTIEAAELRRPVARPRY